MDKRRIAKILMFILAITALPFFSACKKEPYKAYFSEYVFGTLSCAAEFYSYTSEVDTAKQKVIERFKEIDDALNTTKASSEIYKFNKSQSTDYVEISKIFYQMLTLCAEYYGPDKTDGYFDPTIYPLVELWGMSSNDIKDDDNYVPPTIEKVNEVMEYCGFDTAISFKTENGKYFVKKNFPDSMLDFGGIAKGYATDEVVRIAKENGVQHAIVNLSGNMYMLGNKYNGQPWRIRISNPRKSSFNDPELLIMELEDVSAVISGDYQRNHFKEEVRFMHIINPKTGLPANVYYVNGEYTNINPVTGKYDGVSSSLIVDPSSTKCDIYSTYTLIIGIEKAAEFLKNNNVKGIVNTNDMRMAVIGEHRQYKQSQHNAYLDYETITDESYGKII